MTGVNLIPAAVRAQQLRKRSKSAWVRGLRIYAIVALGVALVGQIPARSDADDVNHAAFDRATRRMEITTRGREQIRGLLAEAKARVEMGNAVGRHPDWSAVLEALAHARVGNEPGTLDAVLQNVYIEATPIEPAKSTASEKTATPKIPTAERFTLRVVGLSPTPARAYEYVLRLEKLGVFDTAAVRDTKPERLGDTTVTRFELELVMVGGTPEAARQKGGR